MNKLLKKLKEKGNDTEGALNRFSADENLYLSLLPYAIEEKTYKELGFSLEEGNKKDSFEYAHNLKGMLGNMGLTKMYDAICLIVERLRKGVIDEDTKKNYRLLIAEKDIIEEIISEKYI